MQYLIWGNFFGLIGYGYDWIWVIILPPIIFAALFIGFALIGLMIEMLIYYICKKKGICKNYDEFKEYLDDPDKYKSKHKLSK